MNIKRYLFWDSLIEDFEEDKNGLIMNNGVKESWKNNNFKYSYGFS